MSLRKKLAVAFATISLLLAMSSFVQSVITDYNGRVSDRQESARQEANQDSIFIADVWAVDYRVRNRNLILLLCVVGLVSVIWQKRPWLGVVAYVLTFPLIYQWITDVDDAISTNLLYKSELPYFLRLAVPLDWLLIISLPVTFLFVTSLLFQKRFQ